jgi:hypothetical protein
MMYYDPTAEIHRSTGRRGRGAQPLLHRRARPRGKRRAARRARGATGGCGRATPRSAPWLRGSASPRASHPAPAPRRRLSARTPTHPLGAPRTVDWPPPTPSRQPSDTPRLMSFSCSLSPATALASCAGTCPVPAARQRPAPTPVRRALPRLPRGLWRRPGAARGRARSCLRAPPPAPAARAGSVGRRTPGAGAARAAAAPRVLSLAARSPGTETPPRRGRAAPRGRGSARSAPERR